MIEYICFICMSFFIMAPAEPLAYTVFESGEPERRAVQAPQRVSYQRRSCSDRRPNGARRRTLAQHAERQHHANNAPAERDHAAPDQQRAEDSWQADQNEQRPA